jgi:hypothetical protein
VKLPTVVFRVVTPCDLVGSFQRLGGTYLLHIQGDDNIKMNLSEI